MFLSMTGFASKTSSIKVTKGDKISIYVEIKSINSRFFEAVCKLPSVLSSLEIKIINDLKQKLIRGRVYVTIRLSENEGILEKIYPSFILIEEYIKATQEIKKKFKIGGEITVSDILKLPNIFVTEKSEIGSKDESFILKVIDQVNKQLQESRRAEGKALVLDLEKCFSICAKRMEQIEILFKKLMKHKKEDIKRAKVLFEKGDEQAKLRLDDLYSVLNKIDVHEEVIRFNSHIENVGKIIKDSNVEKGKRLDFVLQELMREANTILAKCSDFEISAFAVDVKVELEKAREQVQNIV